MGAYLSTPRTEKDSSDEKNDELVCGASSMQGWRINQEDAHNCELNFDKDASFFAVYDGHGGPEIAIYCSKYLPEFLKNTEAYTRGDFEQALRDAFLGFDAKLLAGDVIEELKVLAGDKYGYGEDDGADSDSDEDLAELKQEGGMPIEAVLSKYRSMVKNSPLERVKGEEVGGSSSGGGGGSGSSSSSSTAFKPHSPCLRAKKQSVISTSNGDTEQKPSGSCEEAVTSSSSSAKTATDNGDEEQVAASKPMESPDSSSADAKIGNSDAEMAAVEPSSGGSSTTNDASAAATGSSSSSTTVAPTESTTANDVSSSSSNAAAVATALSSSADVEAAGSSSATAATASSAVNGESSSSSSSGGISSTNVERAAKRVALSLSKPTAEDSDDSDEDDKDMTYSENNSTDSEEKLDDEDDDDEEDDEDDEEEEEEEEFEEDDDTFISNMVEEPGKDSGCTAVVAFRHGRTLYVANAGDSRCVLSRSGEVIEMSFDHKPEDELEYTRINKAGGRVTLDGRVNGGLNLSRAIGDHAYKMNSGLPAAEQMISALPDIKKIELTDADDFMVLACDGIWNFMSSEAVIQFVKTRLDKGETHLSKICEELFDHCLAKDTSGDGTGCDNMTAIVVRFKWPESACKESAEAVPAVDQVGLKRAASSSPLPVPEIAGSEEADGGIKAKRAKTEVVADDSNAPTTTST